MPLEPTCAKVTSCRRSPVVLMISISTVVALRAQKRGDVVGLPERELRAAAADAQIHLPPTALVSLSLRAFTLFSA